jgi:hypothetical protein
MSTQIKIEGPLYDPGTLLSELRSARNPGEANRALKRLKERGAGSDYLFCVLAYLKTANPGLRQITWAIKRASKLTLSPQITADRIVIDSTFTTDMIAATLCRQLHALHEKPWPNRRKIDRYFEAVGEVVAAANCTPACLATLHFALRRLGHSIDMSDAEDSSRVWKKIHEGNALVILRSFLRCGVNDTLSQLVDLLSPEDPTRWYWLNVLIVALQNRESFPELYVLNWLLTEVASPSPERCERARLILQGGTQHLREGMLFYALNKKFEQAHYQEVEACGFLAKISHAVVSALPTSLEARHAYIRWLQLNTCRLVEYLLTGYLMPETERGILDIPPAALEALEEIVEQLYGQEYWKIFCATKFPLVAGSAEEDRYRAAQITARPERHVCEVAESVEKMAHGSGYTLEDLYARTERLLDMLSGDVFHIKTTTHLQPTWMPVERRSKDFLSKEVEAIELRRHPGLPERGPACEFRLHLAGSSHVVHGQLDNEGNLAFFDILVLNTAGGTAVQAAVLQALADILIPHYVPGSAERGNNGGGGTILSELAAHRPIIHEEGVIGAEPPVETINSINRIHPTVARWLGEWLLGRRTDIEFDLFEKASEKRPRFKKLLLGKDDLGPGRRGLESTYIRSVRAHTLPVGARFVDGQLVSRTQSSWSRENYAQYIKDGGRALDFTPVCKTYLFPGTDRRVALDVERTFNQGTFMTIAEALRQADDHGLFSLVRTTLYAK